MCSENSSVSDWHNKSRYAEHNNCYNNRWRMCKLVISLPIILKWIIALLSIWILIFCKVTIGSWEHFTSYWKKTFKIANVKVNFKFVKETGKIKLSVFSSISQEKHLVLPTLIVPDGGRCFQFSSKEICSSTPHAKALKAAELSSS